MAGVAQNIQVVSNDKCAVFESDVAFTPDSASLQELIDSELALRISNNDTQESIVDTSVTETIPIKPVHPITFELHPDINEQFIYFEKEHTYFQFIKSYGSMKDDLHIYENIDSKSNENQSESTMYDETVIMKESLDSANEFDLNNEVVDLTNTKDNVNIIEPQEESILDISTNCDLSEHNTISNHVVEVNNSMNEINHSNVELINSVNPSPNPSSPIHNGLEEITSSPSDIVNGSDFDTWMTVEDAMKDPDENVCPQPTVFDVFETIDDGHYEDVVEPSRLIDTTCTNEEDMCVPPLSSGDISESTNTAKTGKKKKTLEGNEAVVTRTKKTKKTKKSEEKENHISVKSSFSKFDQLSKKAVLHVRSSDSAKAQKQFQGSSEGVTSNPSCKACGKTVFAMEQVKAERSVWHKNCFRCKECSKQLTVDIYQSHEGELYCKPHFRELFKPKAILDNADDEPVKFRKPEMIIRENQPMELPPDVIRASDKTDLGLEELSSLNVKSRFKVFENPSTENELERTPSTVNVKRSPSILSKLAKFQKKGMDVGVTDESLNGVEYEESSSSSEEENEDGVIRASKLPERPVSFNKMSDVKQSWETGHTARRAEIREEHKKEIQNIRSRLFMGKQGKMKEMYEQAVAESEGRGGNTSAKKEVEQLRSEKARLLKERYERGEPITDSEDEEKKKGKENEDMSVFEAGISKKSRSLFMELDANAAKTQGVIPNQNMQTPSPHTRTKNQNEDSPECEIYRDPEIIRSDDQVDDGDVVKRSHTTAKMLSLFRQMEEAKDPVPEGPKPLKCFTPPPDYKENNSETSDDDDAEEDESEEEGDESEEDNGIIRASDKVEDEFLKQARNAAKAKTLKEKFEHWEPEKQSVNNAINLLDSEQESIESTKSLRARFESLKSEQPIEKARPKVNRFV